MRITDQLSPVALQTASSASKRAMMPTVSSTDDTKVRVSQAAMKLAASVSFDPVKVASLKGAVQNGSFTIDPSRVASAMLNAA